MVRGRHWQGSCTSSGSFSIQARWISAYLRALPSAIVREKRTDVYGKTTDESDQGEENRSALG